MWRTIKETFSPRNTRNKNTNNSEVDERESLLYSASTSEDDFDQEDALEDLERGPDEESTSKDNPLPLHELHDHPEYYNDHDRNHPSCTSYKTNSNLSAGHTTVSTPLLQEHKISVAPPNKPTTTTTPETMSTFAFWNSMVIVLLCLFIAEASRGMVVPSLWLYIKQLGGDKRFLGYVVGTYSAGRLLGSIVLGWWYNKRGAKEVLIASLLFSIVGNLMYSFSSVTNIWLIFLSRTIVGFGTGILSVVRAFVAESTTKDQRTRFIAYSSAVQFIGFAVVPGVGALLTMIDFRVGNLRVDKFTSAGYLLALLDILILVLVCLRLPKTHPKVEQDTSSTKSSADLPDQANRKLVYWGVALFIFLNFVARGTLALLETVGPPVFLEAWNDDSMDQVRTTSMMMLILGLIGTVVFFLIDYVQRVVREHLLLVFGFTITTLGCFLLVSYYEPENITLVQFLVGAGLIWSIGAPVTQTLVISTFSKILGSKPQGTWMGWIGSAASVGRIISPTLSGFGINESFIISGISSLICTVAVVVYYYVVKIDKRRRNLLDVKIKSSSSARPQTAA